jgi:hypothetical protein
MRAEIASPSASSPRPARIEPSPLLPLRPAAASCSPYASKTSAKNARTTWPKMIGSLTFIIVAFRCTEYSTFSALACAIVSARKASSAFAERNVASTTSRGRTLSPP